MRTILIVSVIVAGSVATTVTAQPLDFWSQRFGSTGSDLGQGVAVDDLGNVVVIGYFNNTVNFGGANLVSAGSSDIFVAKYDPNGLHQWSHRFGSTDGDEGYRIVVDGSGSVVMTGHFAGTVDFGGGNLVSAGIGDIFVAKYSASGAHQWSQRFGSTGHDVGHGVAVDSVGNVVVTGQFQGTVNFGGGNLVSAGSSDIFVAKYNASGVHQWSQRFGSTLIDIGFDTVVDGAGNVIATGSFESTVDFGGGNLVSAGGTDVFLAKYSASGVHQWSQRFGSTSSDDCVGISVDGPGNVVVTGRFSGVANFGGGNLVSAGSSDIFVAKYNPSGVHQWSQRFGSTAGDIGFDTVVDGVGNVIVTGSFQGSVSFGGSSIIAAGLTDIFVAKFHSSGMHQWSQRFGSTGGDDGVGVGVDGLANVVMTGRFNGTVDFGSGILMSAGTDDIFVAKHASVAEPVVTSIVDIGNDQGRQVKIRFAKSGFDSDGSPTPIVQYEAFRRDDAPPSSAMLLRDPTTVSERDLRADGWTQVGSVSAHGESSYGIDVPTIGDSTITAGQYYSLFYIRAATAEPFTYFDSPIDSGYSLDNLAPAVPSGFAYTAGVLSWNESQAEDFDYFAVYGSNTNSFGSATLVDYTTTTDLDVTTAGYVFYFVTATDYSGNEGNPAAINTLSDVGGTPKSYILSISAYPNPFNPGTTVRYTVPTKGRVAIAVYDIRGAHIATLVDQDVEAGAHTVVWNGLDVRGNQSGSGVYFARVVSSGSTRSYKMTLLK